MFAMVCTVCLTHCTEHLWAHVEGLVSPDDAVTAAVAAAAAAAAAGPDGTIAPFKLSRSKLVSAPAGSSSSRQQQTATSNRQAGKPPGGRAQGNDTC